MKREDIVEINDGYVEVIPPKPEDYEFIRLMNKIFIEYVGGDKKKFLALTKRNKNANGQIYKYCKRIRNLYT